MTTGSIAFRRSAEARDTQLVPNLATSIPDARDGGKSYTFRLRAGYPLLGRAARAVRRTSGARSRARVRGGRLARRRRGDGADRPWSAATSCSKGPAAATSRKGVCERTRRLRDLPAEPARAALPLRMWVLSTRCPAGTPSREVGTRPVPGHGAVRDRERRPAAAGSRSSGTGTSGSGPRRRAPTGTPTRSCSRTSGDVAAGSWRRSREGRGDVHAGVRPPARPGRASCSVQLPAAAARGARSDGRTYSSSTPTQPPFSDVRVRQRPELRGRPRDGSSALGGGAGICAAADVPGDPAEPRGGYVRYCPYTLEPATRPASWTAPDLDQGAAARSTASGTRGHEGRRCGRATVLQRRRLGTSSRCCAGSAIARSLRSVTRPRHAISERSSTPQDRARRAHRGLARRMQYGVAGPSEPPRRATRRRTWRELLRPRRSTGGSARALRQVCLPIPRAAARICGAARPSRLVDKAPWVPLFTPQLGRPRLEAGRQLAGTLMAAPSSTSCGFG